MPRVYRTSPLPGSHYGYVKDSPEFRIRPREPVPVSVIERGICQHVEGAADIFFPGPGRSNGQARAICQRCPVQLSCLHYSIREGEEAGVWGGATEAQRRVFVRAYRRTEKLPWVCAHCRSLFVREGTENTCSPRCAWWHALRARLLARAS